MAKSANNELDAFLTGKSPRAMELYMHFIQEYKKLGALEIIPAKTMLGVFNGKRRVAYITRFGKNFLHVVFMFDQAYPDNLCFTKVAQVPGTNQFNHHFRMLDEADVNKEVKKFMKMAVKAELA
ncbi:MAG TPA: DUF5655 domain-containing protein [Flavobacteriales bacterium]|nr:DUF5655 domain-containing protein [Flavobacteriales bacterium]